MLAEDGRVEFEILDPGLAASAGTVSVEYSKPLTECRDLQAEGARITEEGVERFEEPNEEPNHGLVSMAKGPAVVLESPLE